MTRHSTVLVCAASLALGLAGPGSAQEIGRDSFMAHCAVCHGSDGTGHGPMVDLLKSAPSDLTTIAERNGGRFPIQAVYDLIADSGRPPGHGTSEMPIWGSRFNAEVIASEGEYGGTATGVPTAQARILELVFFLATIQTPM
ncbi:c-type cytochrome [Litorisediminicola beolgyonensis]|uniref:C-type cytochrome n=1 Tax=Litorisediminicola beolgyonensis TaxID=1173614 RepID=A0ABW3ZF03_9RHOB